jgi:hypothetical protein
VNAPCPAHITPTNQTQGLVMVPNVTLSAVPHDAVTARHPATLTTVLMTLHSVIQSSCVIAMLSGLKYRPDQTPIFSLHFSEDGFPWKDLWR